MSRGRQDPEELLAEVDDKLRQARARSGRPEDNANDSVRYLTGAVDYAVDFGEARDGDMRDRRREGIAARVK